MYFIKLIEWFVFQIESIIIILDGSKVIDVLWFIFYNCIFRLFLVLELEDIMIDGMLGLGLDS